MTALTTLVTGGAGFIGSHLVDALLGRGQRVVVLDNLSTGRRHQVPDEAVFVHGDVRDRAAVAEAFAAGVDAVFHVAGQASISRSYADPSDDLSVNVNGTLNVLAACLERRVPRLVYASSMTVYGNPEQIPTPETAALDPTSYYGITKLAAERYAHRTAARSDLAGPLAVTSLRMFNVYGPRQRLDNPYQGVLAIFLGALLRGDEITIHSDGEQSRDFVHVDDVCSAWLACLDDPRSHGRVFNLGSGTPTSVNTLCDTLLGRFGLDRSSYPVHSAPEQQGDIRVSAADTTLIRETLGWRPETTLESGLEATVAWARHEIAN